MTHARLAAGIAELTRMLDGTSLASLTLTANGETITIRRDPAGFAERQPASAPSGRDVCAPCPGIFLLRHPLGGETLAPPGLAVAAGDVIGLLRVGPLLVPVVAPHAGTVLAVESADGTLVGYGTPLFRLVPEEARR